MHMYIFYIYIEIIILGFNRSQKLSQHFKVVVAWRVMYTILQIFKWLYKYAESRVCVWKIKLTTVFIKLCFSGSRHACHFWELFQWDCQRAWIWMWVGKQKLLLPSCSRIYVPISWSFCVDWIKTWVQCLLKDQLLDESFQKAARE